MITGDAGEVCSVEVLESQNKSFVPQFTGSKSQSQDHLDEEQLPKVCVVGGGVCVWGGGGGWG